MCLGCQEVRFGEPAKVSSWELRVPRNDAAPPSPLGHPVLRGHSKEHKGTKGPGAVHYTISKLYFVGGAWRAESQILPFCAEKGGLKMKHKKPLGVGTQTYVKRNFPLPCYHLWRP